VIISQTAEYALRAVLYVAQNDRHDLVRVVDIAEALQIPRNYLSKILHVLARAGILASSRGKTGGFRLAVPADHLALLDLVQAFDTIEQRRWCLLGRPVCSDRQPCAAHEKWKGTAETVTTFFRNTTVADLIPKAGTARRSIR
jgi:Rrf2 family protein